MRRIDHSALVSMLALGVACGDDATGSTDTDVGASSSDSAVTAPGVTTETTSGTTAASASTSPGTVTATEGDVDGSTSEPGTGGSTSGTGGCGDGELDQATETCDDGNDDDGDACSADCQTASCLVPITHETVQAGLDDAACPTVWILPGTYAENLIVSRSVRVVGLGPDDVILDGSGAALRVIGSNANLLELEHLVVTGGSAERGAGIRAEGSLTLDDTVVTDNVAEGDDVRGAGIEISQGVLIVRGSEIRDNAITSTASAQGAGISASSSTVLMTQGSRVTGNSIVVTSSESGFAFGAGLAAEQTFVTLGGATEISQNTISATSSGSSIIGGAGIGADDGCVVNVADVRIESNAIEVSSTGDEAVGWGGGMFVARGELTMLPSTYVGNNSVAADGSFAVAQGGGVYLEELAAGNLDGVTLVGNSTSALGDPLSLATGGGLFIEAEDGRTHRVVRSTFSDNTTEASSTLEPRSWGGGLDIAVQDEATVVLRIEQSTFSGNGVDSEAVAAGGAVSAVTLPGTSQLTILAVNSTFSGNTVSCPDVAIGGALAMGGDDSQHIFGVINSTVFDNSSTQGGGIWSATDHFQLHHAIVYGNTATVGPNCVGAPEIVAGSVNVLGSTSDCTIDTTNQVLADPLLGDLADNGGATLTHAPGPSSPALGAGTAGCTWPGGDLDVDQRGEARTGNCTAGSVAP